MSILMLTLLILSMLSNLNISSLSYNIDQLSTILNTLKVKFDIFDITESRLRTDKQAINNIDLEDYVIESTPTAASWQGAFLYLNKDKTSI